MKKLIFLIILVSIQATGNSQQLIRITPDLELIEISENAYLHVSYCTLPGYGRVSANGLIFTNGKSAFLFDTPWSDSLTFELVSYLKNQLKSDITGFIPNHWHDDCMGGLGYLKSQGIKSYANQLTIDIAIARSLPVPDFGFQDSLRLCLGDKVIYCYFPGAAHSTDNIVVWIPSEGILFPGCICKSADSDNLGNISDGDVAEYPHTIDRIINKFNSVKVVIPGHGQFGGPELLTHTKSLITNY